MTEMDPDDPPRLDEVPFGYGATAAVRADLASAGFDDIRITPVPLTAVA